MSYDFREAILHHAEAEYPRECCGLLVQMDDTPVYFPCTNSATTANEHFRIDAAEWAKAEDAGQIVGVVHSHPDYPAIMSEADRVGCEQTQVPWYIQEVRDGIGIALACFKPQGYQAPLIGREFHHGILDCLTIVLDFYKRELNIDLGDYDREDGWWETGKDYYRELLPKAGFFEVKDLQHGDIVLMQIRSPVPNHAGIYLEDGQLKSEPCYPQDHMLLHHLYGRLSRRDTYGGYWADVTVGYWRHKDAAASNHPLIRKAGG